MKKLLAWILAIIFMIFPNLKPPAEEQPVSGSKDAYINVFVHGLGGWGEDKLYYPLMPYWGMYDGDLMKYLNKQGYTCVAPSVDSTASCWDRACELYAQLVGCRVDYGKAHSERCSHARFGTDYTGKGMIERLDASRKINLFGHSFGGATVLTFVQLLSNGSAEEQSATPANELSDLFRGGKKDCVHAIVTLAAPLNGTTAYNVQEEIDADPNATAEERTVVWLLTEVLHAPRDGRIEEDCAAYDLHIDNALAHCDWFTTFDDLYYFSVPCSKSVRNEDGTYSPVTSDMEPLFRAASNRMGKYTGTTPNGYVIDESWRENDGLVNTISAKAPFNAPQKDLDRNNINKGIWNILPTYDGDHMSLQGGLLHRNHVQDFYMDLLAMLHKL